MKTKKLFLKKKTIANLNHQSMNVIKGGYETLVGTCVQCELTDSRVANTCKCEGVFTVELTCADGCI